MALIKNISAFFGIRIARIEILRAFIAKIDSRGEVLSCESRLFPMQQKHQREGAVFRPRYDSRSL
jgi:hypothetical protein